LIFCCEEAEIRVPHYFHPSPRTNSQSSKRCCILFGVSKGRSVKSFYSQLRRVLQSLYGRPHVTLSKLKSEKFTRFCTVSLHSEEAETSLAV
jgi:hypothetical protein